MKALVYHGPHKMSYDDVPDPVPGAGEVLIKVKACGICGSDVHGYMGMTGRRIPPLIMGHEFAGEVAGMGRGVSSWNVGDRAVPYPVTSCGGCDACLMGDTNLCKAKKILGILDINGAMAEYVVLPARNLFKLADGISYQSASVMEPLAVSWRAVSKAGDISGKTVLIIGAGTIGLMALACVKMKSPKKVILSGYGEDRIAAARRMGVDAIINPKEQDFLEGIMKQTGGKGVDVCIEAVGNNTSIKQSFSALRAGGTCVMSGIPSQKEEINMQDVVTRELKIYGSMIYTIKEFGECVSFINEGKLNADPVISLIKPMKYGAQVFAELAEKKSSLIKVVLTD